MLAPSPLFVIGAQRSGTTLIGEIISAQPGVRLLINGKLSYYLIAWLGREMMADFEHPRLDEIAYALGRVQPRNGADFRLDEAFLAVSGDSAPRPQATETVSEFSRRVWNAYFEIAARGASFHGEKYNELMLHLPQLASIFPDAWLVYVHRDPVDVAESMVRHFKGRPWAPRTLSEALAKHERWVKLWSLHRSAFMPKQVYELSYERFMQSPEVEMGACMETLGLRFDSDTLRGFDLDQKRVGRGRRVYAEIGRHQASVSP